MKRTVALLGIMLVLSCVAVLANSTSDPRIIIKDPICASSGCTRVGKHFSFTSPAGGSGTLFFTNSSGVSWKSLELIESAIAASAIICHSNAFTHCNVTTSASGVTTIFLSQVGHGFRGIGAGHHFSITFGHWPASGVEFTAVANVPEPATFALFVSGLGVIIFRRRKLFRQF